MLPNGQQSLVLVSDNNFSATQFTQILAFGVALENETPRRSQSLDIVTDGGKIRGSQEIKSVSKLLTAVLRSQISEQLLD